jgi:hypothetical protein
LLTTIATIVILLATLTFVVGSATGTGPANDGLWRQLLPVTLVMGSLGAVVLVLSRLSPAPAAETQRLGREHPNGR